MEYRSRSDALRSKRYSPSRPLAAYSTFIGLLAAGTFAFFAVIGFAAWLQAQSIPSGQSAVSGLAGAVSEDVFLDMIGMEMTHLHRQRERAGWSASGITRFLFELMTGINPHDPRSVLAGEIHGLKAEKAVLFRSGVATDTSIYPVDHTPSPELLLPKPDLESVQRLDGGSPSGDDPAPATRPDDAQPAASPLDDRHRIKAFIYHSHNRESWVPELEGVKRLSDAYDSKINITLLGQRLAERLGEEGVGAAVSDKDYPSAIKSFNYNLSYSYSLKTVQEAAATYPDLQYYFDIHRDSQARDLTTATIDGADYAQVYFVIGQKNPDWQKNEKFAQQVHDLLEDKYPGLSRGIYGKTAKTGNGEYNQHISPNAILIEVGGPENTLEESYRTIDVLAEVISELIWDAEKVDAPLPTGEVVSASANRNDGE